MRSRLARGTNDAVQVRVEQVRAPAKAGRCFSRLSAWAIRHPSRTLLIAAALTLAAAPGVLKLKLRTDGHALVSARAPEVLYDQAIRSRFGIEDPLIVLIQSNHPDGIFNPGTLQLVRELTAAIARLPEVGPARVMSLATEPGFRLRPKTYALRPLLESALTNPAELSQLREDLRRIELFTGTLVSTNSRTTAILVGVPSGCERAEFYRKIADVIATQRPVPEDIAVTGAPVAEALLGTQILEDLGVPKALLGASAQSSGDDAGWKTPTSLHELRLFATRRIGLVPLAALVMALVFVFCFRNVLAALLPLPGVAAVLLFVFGLMGWLGVPVYLTTAVMPVLITVISVTNDIYLFSRYFSLLRERPGATHLELVEETFDKLARPVACTSLTAVIGFLSFGLSPLVPVRAFGLFTGAGALLGLFFSLTVVPALLVLLNPAWLLSSPRGREGSAGAVRAPKFASLGALTVRRRWSVAGLVLALLAFAPHGLRRLVVQDSWTSGFAPGSEFSRATRLANEQFFGMHMLLVSVSAPEVVTGKVSASAVDAGGIIVPTNGVASLALIENSPITLSVVEKSSPRGATNGQSPAVWRSQLSHAFERGDQIFAGIGPPLAPAGFLEDLRKAGQARFEILLHSHYTPELLHELADLGSFIRQQRQYAVGGVLGPADYLLTTRFMSGPDRPEPRQMPTSAEEIQLLWHSYEKARGPHRLREVVDTNYCCSLTTVFLRDANFVDTAKLMSSLRAYEREHLAPKAIELGFAGDVAVSQSLIRGIVTTQLQSLLWSLVGIFLVTSLFGGSLRGGLFCLLPSLLAVVFKFAVMGWTDISLGVATSMFAAMTLGIGVNCAIHLLEGYRQALAEGDSASGALSRSMRLTGPPALTNTLAVSLGFGVLMLSQVPANARLGLLLVLGLLNCFVVSLLLLPILLHWWPLRDASRAEPVADPGTSNVQAPDCSSNQTGWG